MASAADQLQRVLLSWRNDPVLFVKEALGATPAEWQAEALAALVDHDFLSIRSAHGVGKSAFLAWAILWYLMTRYPVKIPCTAPTKHQLYDVLWAEVSLWMGKMKKPLANQLSINTEKIAIAGAEMHSFAIARTARKENPDAFQGFHAENLMFIVDEACFDDKTEILTNQGWKFFADLTGSEKVLTQNEKGEAIYQKPTKYHAFHRKDEMWHLKIRGADICITPNHRVWYQTLSSKEWRFDEVRNAQFTMNMSRSLNWNATDEKFHVIPGGKWSRVQYHDKIVDMELWASFLGWFISEGSISYVKEKPYTAVITQKDQNTREEIFNELKKMGFNPKIYKDSVHVHSRQLAEHLLCLGKNFNGKRVPDYILMGGKKTIKAFLKSYLKGDGYIRGARDIYYTSSKALADDLQELILKSGECSSITTRKLEGKRSWIKDHWATSTCDGYVVSKYARPTKIKAEKPMFKKVAYDGYVYCVTVEGGLIFTRRNGCCVWTGNSGVDDKIFEVGEGAMSTPGAKTIMVGNPTRRTGYFFDAFHKMSDYWWTKKVSAFDVQEQSYANIQNSERIAARWGKDSNVYRVRVLGEFPIENDDSVIPYWQVEAAIDRDVEPIANIQPIWGLDVARFGDCKTALAKRCGNILMDKVKTWRKRDTMEVAGLILYEYENTEPQYLPSEILVDSIGVGAGVVDRLREYGLPARGINVAEAATMRNDMTRLRDELWWRTREWFERQDVVIPEDEELIGQLTSIGYDAPFGKIKVWSKDKLRESGRESPDVADAFVLTFAGFDRRTVLMDRYTSNDNVLTFGSGRRSRNRRSGHSWYTR